MQRKSIVLISAAAVLAAAVPLVVQAQLDEGPNRARRAGAAAADSAPAEGEAETPPADAIPADAMPAEMQPMESTGEPAADGMAPAADGGTPMDAAPVNPGATAGTLDAYTIQSGDTLWDICARMLGDPFFWPKLWTFNQYITNPHWIYPGNLLNFREGTETSPPQFEVTKPDAIASMPVEPAATPVAATPASDVQEGFGVAPEAMATPAVAMIDPYAIPEPVVDNRPFEINLRQEGLISETQIPPLGHVYKSEREYNNLAENDEVYLRLKDASSATVGKHFTVYRTLRKVKHPKGGGYLGFLVKILADIEITAVNGEVATAAIRTSYDAVNRGDPITDFVSVLKKVNLAPNGAAVEGMIVETMVDGLTIMGNGDVLYVDKGQDDGLKIGNTIDVIRSGDGLKKAAGGERDSSLPNEVVGRLVIVGVQTRTSTAVVVDSFDALKIGDKVRMVQN